MNAPIAQHLGRLWQIHAPLTLFALLTAAATVFFATGIFLDDRVITGMHCSTLRRVGRRRWAGIPRRVSTADRAGLYRIRAATRFVRPVMTRSSMIGLPRVLRNCWRCRTSISRFHCPGSYGKWRGATTASSAAR